MTRSDETPTLPARIFLQVKDGVPNQLALFDLPVLKSTPIAAEDRIGGAHTDHTIDTRDIIAGLARAQRKLVKELRKHDAFEANAPWLLDLAAWVLS